jgi:hypothetical protein
MKTVILAAMIVLIMVTTDAVASSFGVEYDSTGGLGINYNSANDFASKLKADGWTQKFLYGDASAWEKDFKDVSKPGGQDNYYADAVDVVFWEGHGAPDSLYVPPPDDHYVTYDDAIWGNLNLEWILAHSCSVLADDHLADWAYIACAQGAHGMCSHKTTVNACNAGSRMAELLVAGWTFKDAWFQQHIEKQYTGCTARVICTDATKNDKLWNHGGMAVPDPMPGDLWYVWTLTK